MAPALDSIARSTFSLDVLGQVVFEELRNHVLVNSDRPLCGSRIEGEVGECSQIGPSWSASVYQPIDQPYAVRMDPMWNSSGGSLSENTQSPFDSLRKAVSIESGRIIRTGRSA